MDEYEVTRVVYTGSPLNDIINYVYDISTPTQKRINEIIWYMHRGCLKRK